MTTETRNQLRRTAQALANGCLTLKLLPDSDKRALADAIAAFGAPTIDEVEVLIRAIDATAKLPEPAQ